MYGVDVLVVAVLLATVMMRLAIICAVAYLLLPKGPLCPLCHVAMLPIRNRLLGRLLPVVQRRWCLECGWNGVVRRSPPVPKAEVPSFPTRA